MTLYAREQTVAGRLQVMAAIREMVARGDISLGDAVRLLRVGYLRQSRASFARLVGVSQPALAQIETDSGNPTLDTLERILRPFGMRVGFVQSVDRGVGEQPVAHNEADYPELLAEARAIIDRNRRG